MSLLLGSGFSPSTLLYRCDWWSVAEMVVHLGGSPFSTEQRWSSVGLSIRYLFISLTKAFLLQLLRMSEWPSLRAVVVSNFFHLWIMEITVCTGTLSAAKIFLYRGAFPISQQLNLLISCIIILS